MTPTIRRLMMILALTVTWVGLWRVVSVANVASGVIVATAIVATGVGTPGLGGVRPGALAKLGWTVFMDLVRSTAAVTREVLTPTDYTNEGIIAVEVPKGGRRHQLLLTIAITITPGTAVVDVDPQTGTLYLHLLYVEDRAKTEEHARNLVRLAFEALPPANRTEVAP
ncbi:MAG: Na+/H+ antiporter subunit E [Actinomycetota bacterium]